MEVLANAGRFEEAIALVEPLIQDNPRTVEYRMALGMVYMQMSDFQAALAEFEAIRLIAPRNAVVYFPLALAYSAIALPAHALRAAQQFMASHPDPESAREMQQVMAMARADIDASARRLEVSSVAMEQASYLMGEGERALSQGRYQEGSASLQAAMRRIPHWPSPRNNLSLCQFFSGQPDEAIATARQVLAEVDGDNVHALANLVRFLCSLGRKPEAQPYVQRLAAITPEEPDEYLKLAEAYASAEDDLGVYTALKAAAQAHVELDGHTWALLGAAAANLGKSKEALGYWKEARRLDPHLPPHVARSMRAAETGRPGPTPAGRFPYFFPADLVPRQAYERVLQRVSHASDKVAVREIERLGETYPYLADLFAEGFWAGDESGQLATVHALRILGTARAVEYLRFIAFGQEGTDKARVQAGLALAELGAIQQDQPMKIWAKGRWQELLPRRIEISDRELGYSKDINERLMRALGLWKDGKADQAQREYEAVIAKEPRCKEAYLNLGVILSHQGDPEKGEAYFHKALEIDPNYFMAIANLAGTRLGQNRLGEMRELLQRGGDRAHFTPQEYVMFHRLWADLNTAEGDHAEAQEHLESILDYEPDNEYAQRRLEELEAAQMGGEPPAWWQRMAERSRERERKKPIEATDLVSLLTRHSKDNLTALARIWRMSGHTALHKPELVQRLRETITNPVNLSWVLGELSDKERDALHWVVQQRGRVQYAEATRRYGDESKDSPYWIYHEVHGILSRLRVRGLLFVGTKDGLVMLVVADELRDLMTKILR